jgi:hypothetical protein
MERRFFVSQINTGTGYEAACNRLDVTQPIGEAASTLSDLPLDQEPVEKRANRVHDHHKAGHGKSEKEDNECSGAHLFPGRPTDSSHLQAHIVDVTPESPH